MRFKHRNSCVLFIAAVVLGLVAAAQAAAPATYTVTNANDSGAGSLRDIITQANGNPPGINYIQFSGNYTINLLSPLPAISVPVIINDASLQNVVISGDSSMTLLTVNKK